MRINCFLSPPARGSQIKQEMSFFMGQIADLCNHLPKSVVEVTNLCDFQGEAGEVLGR